MTSDIQRGRVRIASGSRIEFSGCPAAVGSPWVWFRAKVASKRRRPGVATEGVAPMIYEFRTYTTVPGKAPLLAKYSAEIGRPIRGDDHGKLEGYWLTEIGPLNQVMHLWSYEDMNHRAAVKAKLGTNEAWRTEYLTKAGPLIVRQDTRLMIATKPLAAPETEGNIYEYRYYRCKVGKTKPFADALTAAMVARERHSKNVCIWVTDTGQPNEVSHLWAYKDLNHRAQVRAAASADPDWQEFLKGGADRIEEMHSSILVPWNHSPLK
jgi:hypothetical protein